MKLREFLASATYCDDLRAIPDSCFAEEEWAVSGYVYAGQYCIRETPADNGFLTHIQFEQGSADLHSLELELFYYYGRHVGERANELTMFDRLDLALHQSDLDAACRYIQDGLGQDDGGLAGQYFSGGLGDTWAQLAPDGRLPLLCRYIGQELMSAGWQAIEQRQADKLPAGVILPDPE